MVSKVGFNDSQKNELIIRRRRKKLIQKSILLFIFLASILTTLCFKHPYFNVKKIQVKGNKNIISEDIIKFSQIHKGDNIFYLNMDKAKRGIMENPYILKAEIERKIPDGIVINVKEREAVFYSGEKEDFFIIDKNGVVLERKKDIKGMNLVKLEGFDVNKCEIGKVININDKRKIEAANTISSLIGTKKDNFKVSLVNISNINNILVYYKNICIKLGNIENLEKKLNRAFSIITQREELDKAKGYIDVSFDGNPVVYIQK
ncbi:cell division protein FtsQ/DivIB [Clostridium rectalis]|uniref:cell division protein FtsQ/DivIB n=1 Tax=Clostridium rectalis TaxID=2040295 RepID=UPI000F642B74|nr:FtsQ-type POTRA domain-containing protein [Clostridium rectalis]